jgi:hypothetical protein
MDAWTEQQLAYFHNLPLHETRSAFELLLYFLAVMAVLGCLIRLGTIRSIIHDFRLMRGPLWDLRTTVDDLKDLAPVLRAMTEQVALLDEKVEAARKQVAELQVESVSERTEASDDQSASAAPSGLVEVRPAEEAEDQNWLALREIWRRNTGRIEYVIDQISDGRTKIAFDRLPRTNYERIINKLQGQKRISAAAANASRSLNELFNSYRPRNRAVPDEVAQSLGVLDKQLDRELVPISTVLAADEDDGAQPPARTPSPATQPQRPNPVSPLAAMMSQTNGQDSNANNPGHTRQ